LTNESLQINSIGRVRRLTLNRPDKRNALDAALCRSLVDAVREAASDRAVGAILLDANGKDFCSGMDLTEALEADPNEMLSLHQDLFSVGAELRKPMVSAVQGAALAGGLGLALNAHIVVASADARFGLTEVRVGLWPYVIFPVVAAAVGPRKATELALTARLVNVEEACRIGIVDVVTELEALHERAERIALDTAEGSASAIEQGLSFVQQFLGLGSTEAAKTAGLFRREAHNSADFREGVLAFRRKRKPDWPSHSS
jgi:enoyl-CoA hydratase/carnithine racemase